jgi:arsenite methyltransferase
MAMDDVEIKKKVRERYAAAAEKVSGCCGPAVCCGPESSAAAESAGLTVGYSRDELDSLPEEANMGLGCGNPAALAGLQPGETVLDLGSGGGIDCFLASRRVGSTGLVIGVDMTPAMIDRARENARAGGYGNVEFRLGEIENLPAADGSVDAVISNCVINLSTDKARVFREAFRVLRPGGRLMVSDLVLLEPLPDAVRQSAEVYVACVAGAMLKGEYLGAMAAAGFERIEVVKETRYPSELIIDDPRLPEVSAKVGISVGELEAHIGSVVSLSIKAVKPCLRP